MLTKQEKEKLKKYPKWIKDYIKELEDRVKVQEEMIDLLVEQDESIKSEIVVIKDHKEFHFDKHARIKIGMKGGMIEITKDSEKTISIRVLGILAVYPQAANSIKVSRKPI